MKQATVHEAVNCTRNSRQLYTKQLTVHEAVNCTRCSRLYTRQSTVHKAVNCTRSSYEVVAVFPLVKPRSWLNVKFRWSMIGREVKFSGEPARDTQDGVITLELPKEGTHQSTAWVFECYFRLAGHLH